MTKPPELPAWAKARVQERRPTWVTLLAVAMLVFGGHLLLGGLSVLKALNDSRQASAVTAPVAPPAASVAARDAVSRDLQAFSRSLERSHPWAVRANAASKIAFGLVMLFAVAAVLSGDRRGRRATLMAAWIGIAYHLTNALFLLMVVRKGILEAAPLLVSLTAARVGGEASVEDVVLLADKALLLATALTATVGLSFSALLLAFFGGRRGRVFYGLERQQPQHGG